MLKIVLIAVIVIGIVALIRSRTVSPSTVTVRQIPSVVSQLAQGGKDATWAVFMFTRNGAPRVSDDDLNLQYSIEHGRVGLEWMLNFPSNVAAADAFRTCVVRHGYRADEREMNGVRYLRVEGTTLDALGVTVLEECFGLHGDSEINLITDGFTWRA